MTFAQIITAFLNSLAVFTWGNAMMVMIGVLILAVAFIWKREPFLAPLGFGCLMANLAFPYLGGLFSGMHNAGLATGILPILGLVGIGASLDLSPLLTRPRIILLSAVGQVGIFFVILMAAFWKFAPGEAASIGIASAAGATSGLLAVFSVNRLAPHLLAPVALAGFLFATFLPVARTGCMRLLAPKSGLDSWEGNSPTSPVPRAQILLPILLAVGLGILFPGAAPLVGAVMLGNLMSASTSTTRLANTVQQTIYPVVLFLLGLTLGGAMTPAAFLTGTTLKVLLLTGLGVVLNAMIWAISVRYAGHWLGAGGQDTDTDMLASLLAAGAILGVASLIA
ncbi:MAG: sodium ion-translocating decarboxylase subunit beta [Anaerolineaceae bacterium]|nr:sodium ion-translocating decarboxylase subunit beta [Anaerolineaceae bacterium]